MFLARTLAFTVLTVIALAACAKPTTKSETPAPICTKEGSQCVYAEGKIGLCTALPATSSACDGGPCLTCMSLH